MIPEIDPKTPDKTGALIRAYRKALGMTQGDLARSVGVTGATVASWENGRIEPPLSRLRKIAEFFNVGVSRLVGGEDP